MANMVIISNKSIILKLKIAKSYSGYDFTVYCKIKGVKSFEHIQYAQGVYVKLNVPENFTPSSKVVKEMIFGKKVQKSLKNLVFGFMCQKTLKEKYSLIEEINNSLLKY